MTAPVPGEFDARAVVEKLLADAVRRRASDVHVEPTASGYELRLRVDGLLHVTSTLDAAQGRGVVNRLMVLGQLLTYRTDIPQEGRLRASAPDGGAFDVRVAVIPTTHGLRAVLRLPADLVQPKRLEELELPPSTYAPLLQFVHADAGMLVVTGPAGSGKTTTIYALLGRIVESSSGSSVVTLEDPVERQLPGVTQIEVSPFGQLTYETALRSILRQDPQVLMLGEIRDAATASLAVQAALSGHRLICTLHAATPAGAIARLLEMGLEPYQITSALYGILAQRLLRRRAGEPGRYEGRVPVSEFVVLDDGLRKATLRRADADELRKVYETDRGYVTMRRAAEELVRRGVTDEAEVQRVLGVAGA